MARWRLQAKHYLNIVGTIWEYQELDEVTKRQKRKQFPVPMYLNPEDVADHNYPGEIIVGYAEYNRDHVFVGKPTPDMEPLDDEAKKISAEESVNWINPIETLPGNYSGSLLSMLEADLQAIMTKQGLPRVVSANQVSKEEFDALKSQMQQLMEQNAALIARIEEPVAETRRL